MKAVIVLAMHGAPAADFPRPELAEFFSLHARISHSEGHLQEPLQRRYKELEKKVRDWPRTEKNDPFSAGSMELADNLRQQTGLEVIIGFNEFCAPTLDEAFDRAAATGAAKIVVVTPMLTRGGEHSAVDIPFAINRARQKYSGINFIYAWPFASQDIAAFLAKEVKRHL